MEHLIGLEWSAGIFGFSLGLTVGAVAAWFASKKPVVEVTPVVEAPNAGEVARLPEPCGNLLIPRMYERWLEADAAGDRLSRHRAEMRMFQAGIDPPADRDAAQTELDKLKGKPA